MKTAMKKLFSLMLVAVLLFSVFPMPAAADDILWLVVHVDGVQKASGKYTTAFETDEQILAEAQVLYPGVFPENYTHSIEMNDSGTGANIYLTTVVSCTHCGQTGHTVSDHCSHCGEYGHSASDHCSHCGEYGHSVSDHCSHCGEYGHSVSDHCSHCGELKSNCPVSCPGNDAYVEPAPAKATVLIRAKAPSDPGYPDGGEFEVDAGTYSVNEIFGKSNFSREHNGYCVTGTGIDGQRNQGQNLEIVAGGEYYLWIELKENTPPVVNPTPDDDDEDSDVKTACKVCGGTVKAVDVDGTTVYMCEACSMDEDACTCEDEPENTQGKVKLTLDYNYWGAADTEMYVNRHDSLLKIIGQIPAPTRDGYLFDGWTLDSRGNESIDHRDYVSSRGTTKIYAQWIEQVQVVGKGYDIKVNLNYNHKMGETLKNVAKGTTMGDALEYINTPYRHGYKFLGWYWDPNCKNDVERRDVVLKDCTIYAKWERAASEVMLKIYTNGNTESPAKIVDLYDHSHDKYISLWEVKEIVKGYYTAKDSDGLSFYGLFDFDGWKSFTHNRHHKGVKDIPVNENGDTVVYVMVHNATVYSSSSSGTADSSNPKTGDMIFTSVTVLGASASCLAVLFYLNKKRAI